MDLAVPMTVELVLVINSVTILMEFVSRDVTKGFMESFVILVRLTHYEHQISFSYTEVFFSKIHGTLSVLYMMQTIQPIKGIVTIMERFSVKYTVKMILLSAFSNL
jgi:hypothetical protein